MNTKQTLVFAVRGWMNQERIPSFGVQPVLVKIEDTPSKVVYFEFQKCNKTYLNTM